MLQYISLVLCTKKGDRTQPRLEPLPDTLMDMQPSRYKASAIKSLMKMYFLQVFIYSNCLVLVFFFFYIILIQLFEQTVRGVIYRLWRPSSSHQVINQNQVWWSTWGALDCRCAEVWWGKFWMRGMRINLFGEELLVSSLSLKFLLLTFWSLIYTTMWWSPQVFKPRKI